MTGYVVTRYYRAPEVVLGLPYSEKGSHEYLEYRWIATTCWNHFQLTSGRLAAFSLNSSIGGYYSRYVVNMDYVFGKKTMHFRAETRSISGTRSSRWWAHRQKSTSRNWSSRSRSDYFTISTEYHRSTTYYGLQRRYCFSYVRAVPYFSAIPIEEIIPDSNFLQCTERADMHLTGHFFLFQLCLQFVYVRRYKLIFPDVQIVAGKLLTDTLFFFAWNIELSIFLSFILFSYYDISFHCIFINVLLQLWKYFSANDARRLISKMLAFDPNERYSVAEALQDPYVKRWFREDEVRGWTSQSSHHLLNPTKNKVCERNLLLFSFNRCSVCSNMLFQVNGPLSSTRFNWDAAETDCSLAELNCEKGLPILSVLWASKFGQPSIPFTKSTTGYKGEKYAESISACEI